VNKMVARVNKDKCMYCGACTSVCPKLALELKETYIHVYDDRCIDCGLCVLACPVGAIKLVKLEGNK